MLRMPALPTALPPCQPLSGVVLLQWDSGGDALENENWPNLVIIISLPPLNNTLRSDAHEKHHPTLPLGEAGSLTLISGGVTSDPSQNTVIRMASPFNSTPPF